MSVYKNNMCLRTQGLSHRLRLNYISKDCLEELSYCNFPNLCNKSFEQVQDNSEITRFIFMEINYTISFMEPFTKNNLHTVKAYS